MANTHLHTFRHPCTLAGRDPFIRGQTVVPAGDDGELKTSSAWLQSDTSPPLRSHFFYASVFSIDDPLSPIPPAVGQSKVRLPARPFSEMDNVRIERQWKRMERRRKEKTADRLAGLRTKASRARLGSISDTQTKRKTVQYGMFDPEEIVLEDPANASAAEPRVPLPKVDDQPTSGKPFARLPSNNASRDQNERPPSRHTPRDHPPKVAIPESITYDFATHIKQVQDPAISVFEDTIDQDISVVVGVQKLHTAELPALQMRPIYWSPRHDVCNMIRGTWFYKATMLPVEADLANRLEAGFQFIRPWTQSYEDEVRSCLDIGPEAELRLAHKLWADEVLSTESAKTGKPANGSANPKEPQSQHHDAQVEDGMRAAGALYSDVSIAAFKKASVMYANAKYAQILQPSQLPSARNGRLGAIRKGRAIGEEVVRGFNFETWMKLNPPKTAPAPTARPSVNRKKTASKVCEACVWESEKPEVTDLILIVHGIGQKLSERMESFHFTHAINSFRREVSSHLENPAIRQGLRKDLGSIIALPVNWRSTLHFMDETAGPNPDTSDSSGRSKYSLKDITADRIPAVREMISDVMLDIPYYLSHHQSKMIGAVINEANRIYRLWVKNNPDFLKRGRVHVIGHSLGSCMLVDILSKQPTYLPYPVDLTRKAYTDKFEFDATNAFFCGSPAGFFLLFKEASLIPRRGRNKHGARSEDAWDPEITAEEGVYGSLAVDNVYNIMQYYDPVAYLMNPTVDVKYAASLEQAVVPSTSVTWMQSFSSWWRASPSPDPIADAIISQHASTNPRPTTSHLPSTVELERHNFTAEKMAERKFYLLNDNGQVDWYLDSSGLLDIQYLNMLSAHSDYWGNQDFIRFILGEVGRTPGRAGAFKGLRATKKSKLSAKK